MRNQPIQPGKAHLWVRRSVPGLVAIFVAVGGTALAAQVNHGRAPKAKAAKKKKVLRGPRGPAGPAGPAGPVGPQGPPGLSSGPAGGALTGNYPNPTLNVSGGPCSNGQALTDVSAQAALTCAPGVYTDSDFNVAAGPTVFPAIAGGQTNTAMGLGALQSTTTGSGNSGLGSNALSSNTTGAGNAAFGDSALLFATTANGNSAFGSSALTSATTGGSNSAMGLNALQGNTSGFGNSALGSGALGASNGNSNTAVGGNSLSQNTTGNSNTASGVSALASNTTGSFNVALGLQAGFNLTTGNENIMIGNPGVAAEASTIRIGNTQTRAFIGGIRGTTTGVGDAVPVLIDSAGQLGTASSSRRVKRDIEPLGALRPLMKLRPVSFRYRSGPPELHYGLIAEQVAKVLPELAVYGSDGLPETVQYQELPPLLLGAIQNQQRQIARQQAQINRLIKEVEGR